MSNFAMGTILEKGFPQAQVHTEFIAQVPTQNDVLILLRCQKGWTKFKTQSIFGNLKEIITLSLR